MSILPSHSALKRRDPLHLIIASGVVVALLIALTLLGLALLRPDVQEAAPALDSLSSCDEIRAAAHEQASQANDLPSGSAEANAKVDYILEASGRLASMGCSMN